MARKLRLEEAGGIYHVINRGNYRQWIFAEGSSAGWARYEKYMAWLAEDEPARIQMEFERMSRGWAIGTKRFRKAVVADEKQLRTVFKLTQAEAREARGLVWEAALATALRHLGKKSSIEADRNGAPWKVSVAAVLKTKHGCTNGWIGRHLKMGAECG